MRRHTRHTSHRLQTPHSIRWQFGRRVFSQFSKDYSVSQVQPRPFLHDRSLRLGSNVCCWEFDPNQDPYLRRESREREESRAPLGLDIWKRGPEHSCRPPQDLDVMQPRGYLREGKTCSCWTAYDPRRRNQNRSPWVSRNGNAGD